MNTINILISYVLIVGIVFINQLFVFSAIEHEGNLSRLLLMFQEYGLSRFFYITIGAIITNVFNSSFIFIWILLSTVIIVQWVTRKISSWIIFIITLGIYQLILSRFDLFSVKTIFNNLTFFVAIGSYLAILISLVLIYFEHNVKKQHDALERIHFMNNWIIYRIVFMFWAILLLVYANYQYLYYSLSQPLLLSVIVQLVFMVSILFVENNLKHKKRESLIQSSCLSYLSPRLLLGTCMVLLPLIGSASTLYLIFNSNDMNTMLFISLLLLFILFTGVYVIIKIRFTESHQGKLIIILPRLVFIIFFLIIALLAPTFTIFPFIPVLLFLLIGICTLIILRINKRSQVGIEYIGE